MKSQIIANVGYGCDIAHQAHYKHGKMLKNQLKEMNTNIGLRLPENIIAATDERARVLQLNRADIVEKTLRCFFRDRV